MDVLYYVHAYTVIGAYHTVYMNQIPKTGLAKLHMGLVVLVKKNVSPY